MKSVRCYFAAIIAMSIALLPLASCGESPGGGAPSSTVNGQAFKGPIGGGKVTAFALNPDGSLGAAAGSATTNSSGGFSLKLSHTGPVEIQVTGGSYKDEATGAAVDMTGLGMSVVLPSVAGGSVAVTPITSAAARGAKTNAANGQEVAASIQAANSRTAAAFGLGGVDITTVTPVDLTVPGATPGTVETNYAAAIAALSQMAKDTGLPPETVISTVEAIGDDLADGELDDSSTGVLGGLKEKADVFLASAQNQSVVAPGDVDLEPELPSKPTTPPPSDSPSEPAPAKPTPKPDITPPVISAWELGSKTYGTITGAATINEDATGYCAAVKSGVERMSVPPTVAQIIAGSGGGIVGKRGKAQLHANILGACVVMALAGNVSYDVYFVAKDKAGNTQTEPSVFSRIRVEMAPLSQIFPDPNLQSCMNKLGLTYAHEVTEILYDVCADQGIAALDGMEHLINLTNVSFARNNIVSLAPLAGLTQMEWLWLNDNNITSLTPLEDLTSLRYLRLENNSIASVTPLMSLSALDYLDLSGNNITDVIPLAWLANLTELYLTNNNISIVSGLATLTNLQVLDLENNNIVSVGPLAELTNLTTLALNNNRIVSVSPLAGLINLKSLYLAHNNIGGEGVGRVDTLVNLVSSLIFLRDNPVMSCSEVAILYDALGGAVDTNDGLAGTPDVPQPGVHCSNP